MNSSIQRIFNQIMQKIGCNNFKEDCSEEGKSTEIFMIGISTQEWMGIPKYSQVTVSHWLNSNKIDVVYRNPKNLKEFKNDLRHSGNMPYSGQFNVNL